MVYRRARGLDIGVWVECIRSGAARRTAAAGATCFGGYYSCFDIDQRFEPDGGAANQIQQIQDDFRQQMQTIAPRPDGGGGPGQGQGRQAPPDAATRAKIETLTSTESGQITALLTPAQTTAFNLLLTNEKELQAAGISPRLYAQLSLTTDQYNQIGKIEAAASESIKTSMLQAASTGNYDDVQQVLQDSHRQTHTQALALLTPAQASLVDSFRGGGPDGQGPSGAQADDHGPGQNGGPGGGFGGPDGGGPGGEPGNGGGPGGGQPLQAPTGDGSQF